jgi:hypothetical protein
MRPTRKERNERCRGPNPEYQRQAAIRHGKRRGDHGEAEATQESQEVTLSREGALPWISRLEGTQVARAKQ